jgi:hypothetical protein
MGRQEEARLIGVDLVSRASVVPGEAVQRHVARAAAAAAVLWDQVQGFDFAAWDQAAAVESGRLILDCAAMLRGLAAATGADLGGSALAKIIEAARAQCRHSLVYAPTGGNA